MYRVKESDTIPGDQAAREIFKILLVDDRLEALMSLEDVLDEPCYQLVLARDGVAALNCLNKDDFAVILLDVKMPGLDGFETARLIKRRDDRRHIPIIFLSAAKEDVRRFAAEGYSLGAVDYLCKPYDPAVLKTKVAAFVELCRMNRRTEAALWRARQARRYENVLNARRGTKIILDEELRVKAASRHFFELFGLSPRQVEGRPVYCLEQIEWGTPRLKALMSGVLAKGAPFKDFDVEATLPALGRRALRLHARRIAREAEESPMVLLEIEDVTETSQAKEVESSRRREAMQRDFVANISHELRTPVAAIKGFAETLRRGAINDPKNRLGFVKTIEKHSELLRRLTEDLLSMSAQESGKRKPEPARISLASFVKGFIRGIAPVTRGKCLSLSARIPPELEVVIDPCDLERVLQSLCENAVKFSRPEGEIEVSARVEDGKAVVSVKDGGHGIPHDVLPALFERRRPGKASAAAAMGSGLGLLIAKSAVEANQGKIWATNNEGPGAAFHFSLPLAS